MREAPTDVMERGRIKVGPMASDRSFGTTGAFRVAVPDTNVRLSIVASSDHGWEHVSARVFKPKSRVPKWREMAWVKDQFWLPTETVMQLHVPEEDHINNNSTVLHLWRPSASNPQRIPRPPLWMVGVKALGELA